MTPEVMAAPNVDYWSGFGAEVLYERYGRRCGQAGNRNKPVWLPLDEFVRVVAAMGYALGKEPLIGSHGGPLLLGAELLPLKETDPENGKGS